MCVILAVRHRCVAGSSTCITMRLNFKLTFRGESCRTQNDEGSWCFHEARLDPDKDHYARSGWGKTRWGFFLIYILFIRYSCSYSNSTLNTVIWTTSRSCGSFLPLHYSSTSTISPLPFVSSMLLDIGHRLSWSECWRLIAQEWQVSGLRRLIGSITPPPAVPQQKDTTRNVFSARL